MMQENVTLDKIDICYPYCCAREPWQYGLLHESCSYDWLGEDHRTPISAVECQIKEGIILIIKYIIM